MNQPKEPKTKGLLPSSLLIGAYALFVVAFLSVPLQFVVALATRNEFFSEKLLVSSFATGFIAGGPIFLHHLKSENPNALKGNAKEWIVLAFIVLIMATGSAGLLLLADHKDKVEFSFPMVALSSLAFTGLLVATAVLGLKWAKKPEVSSNKNSEPDGSR